MNYTNMSNMPLLTAVWAIADDYQGSNKGNMISATSLIKCTKQLVMNQRVDKDNLAVDLNDLVPSSLGSAIHASIEKAWLSPRLPEYLEKLGISKDIASRVVINPKELQEGDIPVYLEQRSFKKIGNWTINGQFDAVIDGQLIDNKTMGVYGFIKGNHIEDFILQGSIYRWLNQDLITNNKLAINYIFTDWSKIETYKPEYPKYRVIKMEYPLKSLNQTEVYIKNKINELEKYMNADEQDIPRCNDKDLWRDPPRYKVYKDYSSSKAMPGGANFESIHEAQMFAAQKGGIIKTIESQVRRCPRCPAYSICEQRKEYYPDD